MTKENSKTNQKAAVRNRSKEMFMANPIERHNTAAWAQDVKEVLPESNVPIPSEEAVMNAKEWVDSNSLS